MNVSKRCQGLADIITQVWQGSYLVNDGNFPAGSWMGPSLSPSGQPSFWLTVVGRYNRHYCASLADLEYVHRIKKKRQTVFRNKSLGISVRLSPPTSSSLLCLHAIGTLSRSTLLSGTEDGVSTMDILAPIMPPATDSCTRYHDLVTSINIRYVEAQQF